MGKDIGKILKRSQFQLSTPSIKALVLSYLAYQTSSSIELTITYVPSVMDKKQTNYVFCFKNSIQNDLSITNNDYIHSCDKEMYISFQPLQLQIIMHNVLLPHR